LLVRRHAALLVAVKCLNFWEQMRPSKEEIYEQIKLHNLYRVIRGEVCIFKTPPHVNAELLPTDHDQLLIQGLYPLATEYSPAFIQRELDLALRVAASDGIGVFCAIRCYFMQICNEDNGDSNIKLDRVGLAQFLTSRYFALLDELKVLILAEQPDYPDYAQRMALRYLTILKDKHKVQLTAP
jgi:hypothetical protein